MSTTIKAAANATVTTKIEGGTIMSNLNFVFAGPFVVLTENVSKRGFSAIDGTEATTKSTTFEVVERNGFTRIMAKEAVTNAGHRWDSYPECFCDVVASRKLERAEIKKLILVSSFIGAPLRLFDSKESMSLDWRNAVPVMINEKGEVEGYNGTVIKY